MSGGSCVLTGAVLQSARKKGEVAEGGSAGVSSSCAVSTGLATNCGGVSAGGATLQDHGYADQPVRKQGETGEPVQKQGSGLQGHTLDGEAGSTELEQSEEFLALSQIALQCPDCLRTSSEVLYLHCGQCGHVGCQFCLGRSTSNAWVCGRCLRLLSAANQIEIDAGHSPHATDTDHLFIGAVTSRSGATSEHVDPIDVWVQGRVCLIPVDKEEDDDNGEAEPDNDDEAESHDNDEEKEDDDDEAEPDNDDEAESNDDGEETNDD